MVLAMPVEFLTDHEAASFGRYGDSVPQADLERYFFLDDGDRAMVAALRGDHNRLGFSIQLATVRYIGRFLPDPLEGVSAEAIDFLAGQLQIADPSCVKRYALRQETHREHAGKIQKALKLRDFSQVEADLSVFAGGRAWVTGTARRRSSLTRWGGCGSATRCCLGCRGWPAWWRGSGTRRRSGCGTPCTRH